MISDLSVIVLNKQIEVVKVLNLWRPVAWSKKDIVANPEAGSIPDSDGGDFVYLFTILNHTKRFTSDQ